MTFRKDYVECVYAGVLGKLIVVYLGWPSEGWIYEGKIYLDYLTWEEAPSITLTKPSDGGKMWIRACFMWWDDVSLANHFQRNVKAIAYPFHNSYRDSYWNTAIGGSNPIEPTEIRTSILILVVSQNPIHYRRRFIDINFIKYQLYYQCYLPAFRNCQDICVNLGVAPIKRGSFSGHFGYFSGVIISIKVPLVDWCSSWD